MSDETTSSVDGGAVSEKTRRILIVDDEIDITAIHSMLSELHGFQVLTASNGRQALGLIATEPPDIVVSDCMMPVMDGFELTRALRSDPKTARIPIILMSALPDPEKLGASAHDLFLQKPAIFSTLLKAVKRMLGET